MLGTERNDPHGRFALPCALRRRFKPVSHGVANKMCEWICYELKDLPIDFRIFSLKLQGHLFPLLSGDVSNHPWKPCEERADGEHADAPDDVLKIICEEMQIGAVRVK